MAQTKKKKTADMQSTPGPSKHLVEAVRKEITRLIALPNLEQNLGMISRFARQADDMLIVVKSPEAVLHGEHSTVQAVAVAQPANVETYGSQLLRQLVPVLQNYQKVQQETPENLVHAIVTARRNGMTDVAAELEKKLTGKALDGERPLKSPFDEYISPLPPLPKPDESTNGKSMA